MPRPKGKRLIHAMPCCCHFMPADLRSKKSPLVILNLDEFEAVRLADFEHMYQAQAAKKMKISRPTFTRLIESAHSKIAKAIVYGAELKIEGGNIRSVKLHKFICDCCNRTWEIAHKAGKTIECPVCHGNCHGSHHKDDSTHHHAWNESKCSCHNGAKKSKRKENK